VAKILLMSILIATAVAPLVASRDPKPARGLKKTIRWIIWFNVVWVFALVVLYGRLI
jgi:hypothetical protein